MTAAIASSATQELENTGLVVLPNALDGLLDSVVAAADRVYAAEREAGRLAQDGSLHLLGALGQEPAFLELVDLPATLSVVVDVLGWNIYAYHSHLDVHLPTLARPEPEPWRWHQDGGRQNLELETDPRPRLSLKVAFFLSDVSEPGRGNLLVVPGSHRRNLLEGRARRKRPPEAVPVLAEPGSAVVFDRRLWHARSDNRSRVVRKAIFIGYTYRWIRPREDLSRLAGAHSPIRRQLLGASISETGAWLPTEADVPLRAALERSAG